MAEFNLNSFAALAMSLLVVAVVFTIGAGILQSIKTGIADKTATHANQSFTFLNGTSQSFAEKDVDTGSVVVYNQSIKLNQGRNYTVTTSGITFINESAADGMIWTTETGGINVSYNYKYGSPAGNITQYGLQGQKTLASYIPTIALVAVAAVIIGIILVMFRRP